jgi:hypothetical protein
MYGEIARVIMAGPKIVGVSSAMKVAPPLHVRKFDIVILLLKYSLCSVCDLICNKTSHFVFKFIFTVDFLSYI